MNKILCLLFLCCFSLESSPKEKPNVLFIICDDLNDYISDLGGHPQAKTPHLSRIAKSAALFTHAFSNSPVCAPSRASFLTGIYPHSSLNLFFEKWYKNPVLKNSKTIMRHFKDNGYHVAGTGKIMHDHIAEEWTEYKNKTDYGPYWYNGKKRVAHPSVPEPFASIGCIDGSYASLGDIPANNPEEAGWITGWGSNKMLNFSNTGKVDLTPDEANAKWASQKLEQFAKNNENTPFFLAIGFVRPHTPLHVPQKYFDLFPEEKLKMPILQTNDKSDTHYTSELFPISKGLKYFELLQKSYPGKQQGLKAFMRAYLASVAAVDDCIGQVLNTLDSTLLKDNTIVIITSDHGWNMGEKDYIFKNSLWDESARVPLIIRAPGFSKKGSKISQPVSLIDIFPTLIDLCGLKGDTRINQQGVALDGHSLKPLLINPAANKWDGPKVALSMIWAGRNYKKNAYMQHWSVRSLRYRYIRYNNGKEELYDHKHDPNEWHNLATNPELQSVKNHLYQELLKLIPDQQSSLKKAQALRGNSTQSAETWKNKYFSQHPESDTNKDGVLSWAELKSHQKSAK